MRVHSVKRRAISITLAAVVSVAAISRAAFLTISRRAHGSIARAAWIWSAPDDAKNPMPSRIWASRAFHLGVSVPAATIRIIGDDSYRLLLDGSEIGRGGQRPGDAVDVYEIAGTFVAGAHRLDVEAWHSEGLGGILLSADFGPAGTVVSDGSWSVDAKPAFVIGRPPIYPWRFPSVERRRSASLAATQ